MYYSDSCYDMSKNEESERTIEIEIPYHLLQFLSTEGSDIQNLCRICLSVQKNMIGLFSSPKLPLSEMLSSFSTVWAQVEDGLPPQICEVCEAQVISCYNFKVKCEKSDHTLKSLLKGEFIVQEKQSLSKDIKQEELAGNLEECKDTDKNLIENQERSLSASVKEEKNYDVENIKEEVEIHEDIQYLENLSDDEIGEETLLTVRNKEEKEKTSNKKDAKLVSERMACNESKIILKEDLICLYCSKKFKKKKALQAHLKDHHSPEGSSHPCGQCKEVFSSGHDLALHSAVHEKGPAWTCNQCSKEFKTRAMLRRHVSRHMESKKFSCASCGKSFAELYALRRHARVHTGEQREKKHACPICDKRYGEISLLATHMAGHSGARPFPCADCGKGFASARLLGSHRAVHSDTKRHGCRYCDARFRHETTLKTHERTHTGEKPYVCATCGKAFIQNSNLRLHMRTHTGERPYECKQCARRFTSSSSLKAHQRTHSGEKPYTCMFCDKRFACANFREHLRRHTGERPFQCSACRKTFVSAARLREHCRVHTGEKPFECTVCNQSYATKSHLTKHLKVHEKEKKTKKVRVKRIDSNKEQRLTREQEMAMEVSGELVVQDDCEQNADILVVDNSQIDTFQSANICINDVTYVNNDNLNLVTMNEGGVGMPVLDGTVVKLYQLDQRLVQIHSSCAQVTISKITSKMTANF